MAEGSYKHRPKDIEAEWRLASEGLLLAKRNQKFTRAAISHAYYAMFHAMAGALLSRDIIAHTHSGMMHKFSNEFIKTGVVEDYWGALIKQIFKWRMYADYAALKEITPDQAQEAITQATAFLKVVRKLLEKEL